MVQRVGCGVGHTLPWPVASSGTGTKSPAPLYLDDAAFSAIGQHMWNRHQIPESVSSQAAADTPILILVAFSSASATWFT